MIQLLQKHIDASNLVNANPSKILLKSLGVLSWFEDVPNI